LPDHIIERFANGKVMAMRGYEVDQVRTILTEEGEEEEVSVPITWAYNHHYISWLLNTKKSRVVEKPVTKDTAHMSHGNTHIWVAEEIQNNHDDDDDDLTSSSSRYPSSQFISEANGGEMRKSWHNYPDGHAQLVQSPVKTSIF
jgi:hypothetical protein